MKKKTTTTNNRWFAVGVAISLSAASFAKSLSVEMDEPWREDEAPSLLANMSEADHYLTSEDGSDHWIKTPAWSGHWWPTREGSIAYRWYDEAVNRENSGGAMSTNSSVPSRSLIDQVRGYHLYTATELSRLDPVDLKSLSPVEKLDILAGNATYPGDPKFYRNTKSVIDFSLGIIKRYPKQLAFHGLCAGYSNASLLLPEPAQYNAKVHYTLKDGSAVELTVRLFSGDFKALATYFYAQAIWDSGASRKIDKWIGCGDRASGECDGLNAGSFHLVLANMIKKRGEGLVIDTDRGTEVWNFPIIGYRSTISKSFPVRSAKVSPEAVKEVDVVTTITLLDESDPSFRPYGENNSVAQFERTYYYRLELTADNRVLGGTWMDSRNPADFLQRRPDFAWRINQKLQFTGDYRLLDKYWKPAAQN